LIKVYFFYISLIRLAMCERVVGVSVGGGGGRKGITGTWKTDASVGG